jgi:hypothetical protein
LDFEPYLKKVNELIAWLTPSWPKGFNISIEAEEPLMPEGDILQAFLEEIAQFEQHPNRYVAALSAEQIGHLHAHMGNNSRIRFLSLLLLGLPEYIERLIALKPVFLKAQKEWHAQLDAAMGGMAPPLVALIDDYC